MNDISVLIWAYNWARENLDLNVKLSWKSSTAHSWIKGNPIYILYFFIYTHIYINIFTLSCADVCNWEYYVEANSVCMYVCM